MSEQITPIETDAGAEAAQLRKKLERSSEEVLRLRDLLIGKDAELGSLKGQVAQLEAGTARLLGLVTRIRSLLPSFVWAGLGKLRGRLGRQG